MDISDTLAPKSDQLDAVDLLDGPRTFTIDGVTRGNAEQPVQIKLAEFPRVWRPSKGMRRVLVAAWGPDSSTWTGRRVTLYCDPDVRFGGDRVGGTRIKALSDLPGGKRIDVPMLVSRGKSAVVTVQPITDPTPAPARTPDAVEPTARQVAGCGDLEQLKAWWRASGQERRTQIEARVAELTAAALPANEPAPLPDGDPGDTWPDAAVPGGERR